MLELNPKTTRPIAVDRATLPLVAGNRCSFCQSCKGYVGDRCSVCGEPQRFDANDLEDDEADR